MESSQPASYSRRFRPSDIPTCWNCRVQPKRKYRGSGKEHQSNLQGHTCRVRHESILADCDVVGVPPPATLVSRLQLSSAYTELERAGVIAPTGSDDANGNPMYRLLTFPSGKEGERLKSLFDFHIQGRVDQRRE